MILYGSYASPYVRHCRIALMQSSLQWQFEVTDYLASANTSPAKKVPYLIDGERLFTDSSSILFHIRKLGEQSFIETAEQMELYALANTALDACINLFLLAKENVTPDNTPYLQRQAARIQSTLAALNNLALEGVEKTDCGLRLACFLDWAVYREQISLDGLANLNVLLRTTSQMVEFVETPPWQT